ASKGFKSGGFNGRANNAGEQAPYDPEQATSYEAGMKSQWFDGRLMANATIFYNDYQDFQARVSGLVIDPVTSLPSPELTVINAGSLVTQGLELELAARPVRGLLLDAQIGYLDAEYEDFDDARFGATGGSRAFQKPPFSPEWTMRYGAQYELDLGAAGFVTVGGQAKYRSEMALAIDNTPTNSAVRLPGMWDAEVWLFDARVVWETPDRRFSAGVYGQNLSDEVYKTDAQEFSSVGGIRTAYYGAPQTWTLRLTARY
ncbi:MAG: TonB-dependent receptor, partial [Caulobacter sp.]|nr:TonB-dependent receptor [Caulobacter sp.]